MTAKELQAFCAKLRDTDYPEIVVTIDATTVPMLSHFGPSEVHKGRLLDVVKSSAVLDLWVIDIQVDPWNAEPVLVFENWDCIRVVAPAAAYASGTCPKCGDDGEWRMLALFCRKGHGRFAG